MWSTIWKRVDETIKIKLKEGDAIGKKDWEICEERVILDKRKLGGTDEEGCCKNLRSQNSSAM